MPEAAVDEDSDLAAREGDIWSDQPTVDPNRMVLPESITHSVERGTEGDLRFRIAPPYRGHVSGTAGRRDVACGIGRRRRANTTCWTHADTVRGMD